MNLLLDEWVPRPLKAKPAVGGLTAPEAGLAGKSNGELPKLAQEKFDVFITLDRGLIHQQNLVVIRAKSNRRVDVLPFPPSCLEMLKETKKSEVRFLEK